MHTLATQRPFYVCIPPSMRLTVTDPDGSEESWVLVFLNGNRAYIPQADLLPHEREAIADAPNGRLARPIRINR